MMAKLKPGGQPNQGNNRGGTNIIPGQSGMSVSLQWQTYSKKLLENRGNSPNRQPQGAFMVRVVVKLPNKVFLHHRWRISPLSTKVFKSVLVISTHKSS